MDAAQRAVAPRHFQVPTVHLPCCNRHPTSPSEMFLYLMPPLVRGSPAVTAHGRLAWQLRPEEGARCEPKPNAFLIVSASRTAADATAIPEGRTACFLMNFTAACECFVYLGSGSASARFRPPPEGARRCGTRACVASPTYAS
eukprot:SAG11_NODE_1494_length_4803_cov_1.551233_7_plen_143_part_00